MSDTIADRLPSPQVPGVREGELMSDTIVALASARGRAGIAVIRMSGPGSGAALSTIAGILPPPRRASYRRLRDRRGATLDKGMVLWLPGPDSFTGEDVAELHVHGGRAVVESVLHTLSGCGLRLAESGEFTRRAFENGRMDLTEVEGLADLIDAETEAQRRQAVAQADGALRQRYEHWRSVILSAQADIESRLDFADQADVHLEADGGTDMRIAQTRDEIEAHLADGRRGEILRGGFQVVIAGPPNAGKSSLLNALAGRDAAIVSATPGTTRDPVEVHLDLGGFPVIATDTAGLRDAASGVEAEGVRRALRRAEDADLVIWLTDSARKYAPPPSELADHPGLIVVRAKSDRARRKPAPAEALLISVTRDHGVADLVATIAARARGAVGTSGPPPLTRLRHRQELEAVRDALLRFLWNAEAPFEMKAEELRLAAAHLGRVTGRIDVEDVLGEIFASFCIGK